MTLTKLTPPELTYITQDYRERHASPESRELREQIQALNRVRAEIERAATAIVDELSAQSLLRHDGFTAREMRDLLARLFDEVVSDEMWNARAINAASEGR